MSRTVLITFFVAGLSLALGCPNGERRRRRSASGPINDRLATFFGSECRALSLSASGVLPSLQSTVDYVLRDTKWYQLISMQCEGNLDVSDCWIEALQYLIDDSSVLFKPTVECIRLWSQRAHVRSKRSDALGASFLKLNNEETEFTSCLKEPLKQFLEQYPSIERFDARSVTIFLKGHYTYCRGVPEILYDLGQKMRLLPPSYLDILCPRSGPAASWRKDVIEVYIRATRNDGPLKQIIMQCDPKDYRVRDVRSNKLCCGNRKEVWEQKCFNRLDKDAPYENCKGSSQRPRRSVSDSWGAGSSEHASLIPDDCGPHPKLQGKCEECIPAIYEVSMPKENVTATSFLAKWESEPTAKCYYVELDVVYSENKNGTVMPCVKDSFYEFTGLHPHSFYFVKVSAVSFECQRGPPGTAWLMTKHTSRPK